ncbi:MAG: hypothetical protein Q4F27_06340 [Desulfovibrionaceae bacterium]|nr:hypothetical protein [Desulfovibrionaceae bacterium]
MDSTQMAMSVAVTRESLDFQASMSAAVINGSIDKGAEMQQNLARVEGLAAEGIGSKLNIQV